MIRDYVMILPGENHLRSVTVAFPIDFVTVHESDNQVSRAPYVVPFVIRSYWAGSLRFVEVAVYGMESRMNYGNGRGLFAFRDNILLG